MTLTVPRAPRRGGRAAQPQVEADSRGEALAQFGARVTQIGTAIQNERLARTEERLAVDLTNDFYDLRLEAQQIGDPEALDAFWVQRSAELRERYVGESGLVPTQLRSRFATRFDSQSGRHGFELGTQAIDLRNSQRIANLDRWTHTASRAAAGSGAGVRAEINQQTEEMLDAMVRDGVLTPEQAEARRQGIVGSTDVARANILVDEDPQGFLDAVSNGELTGLTAEQVSRLTVRANSAIESNAASAEREITSRVGSELSEIRDLIRGGFTVANMDRLNQPEYQQHEDYAETMALVQLTNEMPNLYAMTVQELEEQIAQEAARPRTYRYANERMDALIQVRDELASLWVEDPIEATRTAGIADVQDMVAFDPANPGAFEALLRNRAGVAQYVAETGHAQEMEPTLFDRDEVQQIRAMAGVDQSPDARLGLSALLYEYEQDHLLEDPVLRHVGGMVAQSDRNRSVAEDILRGQQVLDADNIVLPPLRDRLPAVFDEMGVVFADLPGGEYLQSTYIAAADALYASRVRRVDPAGDFDPRLYRQVLHEVMGGTGEVGNNGTRSGTQRGGIQLYNDDLTIFPPGVRAVDMEFAIDALAGVVAVPRGARATGESVDPPDPDRPMQILASVSRTGQPPAIGGQPVDLDDLADLSIRAIGPDQYVFLANTNSGAYVVTDLRGQEYVFSMTRFLREARR